MNQKKQVNGPSLGQAEVRGAGEEPECGPHQPPAPGRVEGPATVAHDGHGARHPFSSSRGNLTPSEGGALERPTHFTDKEIEA